MLSPAWKILLTVINFLNYWSISLSSSLVHFKNGPEYLMRRNTKVFVLLLRFQKPSLVSFFFLFLYLFNLYLMVSAFNIPKYLWYFIISFWYFQNLIVLFCLLSILTHFSLLASQIFQCQIPFLYPIWIFVMFLSRSPVLFSFLVDTFISYLYVS